MICKNITKENGRLLFAGVDVCKLAEKYGTPLYIMDEDRIRENCRTYKEAFRKHFGEGSYPLYASKACSFKEIYRIMSDEEMGIDVVSSGEIYTALQGGYDLSKAYFHSNNKTDQDIEYAMDNNIGYFVADNIEEVKVVEREAAKRGITQKLMLRITPGIDPHTYEENVTGNVDSKFGSAIETGQAEEITEYTLNQPHIKLVGFHCHVGSQVFDEDVFERAAVVMVDFMADMKKKFGFTAEELDLGGGYGVRYVNTDPYLDPDKKIGEVAKAAKDACKRNGIEMPKIHMEPGRSIVADAGMTLYTVGTVKRIPGYKNYVSIDGGMPDNARYILYKAEYTCYVANKMDEPKTMKADLVGRCCESGDIVIVDEMFPESTGRYDIVAVPITGAYNYALASNYNKIPFPATVMLKGGKDRVVIRRQTLEDLASRDV